MKYLELQCPGHILHTEEANCINRKSFRLESRLPELEILVGKKRAYGQKIKLLFWNHVHQESHLFSCFPCAIDRITFLNCFGLLSTLDESACCNRSSQKSFSLVLKGKGGNKEKSHLTTTKNRFAVPGSFWRVPQRTFFVERTQL